MFSPNAKYLLDKAAKDPHHRVVVNALLACYLAKIPPAMDRIIMGAQNPSPLFRASVAWAMGYAGDAAFLPHLEALARDEHDNVRNAASAALQKFLNKR